MNCLPPDYPRYKKRIAVAAIPVLFHVGPQSPGTLTAHGATLLSLLPSGPDEVRGTPLRKTKALWPDLKKNSASSAIYPKKGYKNGGE